MATPTKKEETKAPVSSAPKFKIKQRLTYPQLKLANEVPVYFKFDDKIFRGKEVPAKEGEKQKQPPMLARGVDLSTGVECEMIINAVVESVLNESFPNAGYIGRGFMLTKNAKEEGKAYNKFDVVELDLD